MKKVLLLFFVGLLGGFSAIGIYNFFFNETEKPILQEQNVVANDSSLFAQPVNYTNISNNPDFTEVAQKTVNAVVHVKNVTLAPRSIHEHMSGMYSGKAIRGAGSGVIITQDGYIVTNNHVIEGANEIQVTLNNNKTYQAELIGRAPQADIALLKINENNLSYLPFGDSDQVKVGEWALAVGNPFNLTSTVTAGIISAKGRDLNEGDSMFQSFIQTDAAINPGNSGGALVNSNGQLIGINTAISSQTGSFIGYGFAVPSNNTRKIVEDLLEYGDIQQAILGITGSTVEPGQLGENNLQVSQGVYVNSVSDGAKAAGLQTGDLITNIDGVRIRKFEDLSAFIQTKRPEDVVQVNFIRSGKEKITKVKLSKYEVLSIQEIGVEITNADEEYLSNFNSKNGVRILRPLHDYISIPKDEFIITKINDIAVNNISEVRKIINQNNKQQPLKVTFKNKKGKEESYIFRP